MKHLTIALVVVLCLVGAGAAYAIDEDPPGICDGSAVHPAAEALAERYDEASYEQIVGWFCQGYGIGEIRLALSLAAADGEGGTGWETLLAAKTDDVGWGQIKIALWVARATGEDWTTYLAEREAGAGWGEIKQALGLIGRSRTGAEEVDTGLDDELGPPPHAGPKWWADETRPGPPPHAGPKDR